MKLGVLLLLCAILACEPQALQTATTAIDTPTPTAFRVPLSSSVAAPEPPSGKSARVRLVELHFAGGVLVGASPEVIDAIDAAFVARVDLLAILHDGDIVRGWLEDAKLVAVAAPIGGRILRAALFKGAVTGWFDDQGMGMDGVFRARPVYASRITSRYGLRFHPLDKQTSLHQGTDYGAAIGTPVHATAQGVVTTATQDATAGKHIKLTHAAGAQTLYLHLSAFAAGLAPGVVVQRDQVIGYVGTTGKSTGPHLHYELRFAGLPVDATRMIPKGLTALGPFELRRHQAFLNSLP